MRNQELCPFYLSSRSLGTDLNCGWCELDFTHASCDGEISHCEKVNSLKQYVMKREWMKEKSTYN